MTSNTAVLPRNAGDTTFEFSELLYSRTDPVGIIQSGNAAFQQVNQFDWKKLIGAPHNLLRHADMPRGVFWLIWDALSSGDSIAAYIMNKTAEGDYYWTLANFSALDVGFISAQIKPSSPILAQIADIYDEMRKAEVEEDLSPEQSATLLKQRLKEQDFESYAAFMANALATEHVARDAKLERPKNPAISLYQEVLTLLQNLRLEGDIITRRFGEIRSLQTNMQIKARRMGSSSSALSVISINFSSLADEIRDCIDTFLDNSDRTTISVQSVLHLTCSRLIKEELISQFDQENNTGTPTDPAREIRHLTQLNHESDAQARRALGELLCEVEEFRDTCIELKRTLAALGVTRVMSQIENERSDSDEGGVGQVIVRLQKFHEDTQKSIREIERNSNRLHLKISNEIGAAKMARAG